MRQLKPIVMAACLTTTTGCATMKDSLLVGFTSGAAIGAAGGLAVDRRDRTKSAAIGALTGGIIGTAIAHFTHKGLERRDATTRRETLFNLDKNEVSTPAHGAAPGATHGLTLPLVDSEIIEEHVSPDGRRLIEKHRVWTIRQDSQWTRKPRASRER